MEVDTSAFSRPPLQTIFQQNHFVPQILILRIVWIQPDKDIGEKGGQTESDKRRAHGESQTRITKVKMTRRRDFKTFLTWQHNALQTNCISYADFVLLQSHLTSAASQSTAKFILTVT